MEIRLKFRSTGHLTFSNMSNLIPHCSNWWKIIFWAWWGSSFIEMKISKNKSHLFYGLNLWLNGFWPNRNFANYHPPLPLIHFLFWIPTSGCCVSYVLYSYGANRISQIDRCKLMALVCSPPCFSCTNRVLLLCLLCGGNCSNCVCVAVWWYSSKLI